MVKRIDITGNRYGRLAVISYVGYKEGKSLWNCVCDCGNTKSIAGYSLRKGITKSCGCLQKETATKHGYSRRVNGYNSEYKTWVQMIQRCENNKSSGYKDYGGRGVMVCERWKDFSNFIKDMGIKPTTKHTLERIDNQKGYSPENCKWETPIEQSRNQRVRNDNKHGVRGVFWSEKSNKYQAQITTKGKRVHLGTFNTLEEAKEARKQAELKYWGKSSL